MVLLIIIIVFILVVASVAAGKNKNEDMDALAMHENLKRNHPDDALGQLGPHEFQRALHIVKRKRAKKELKCGFLWWLLGMFIGTLSFMFILIIMDNSSLGGFLGFLAVAVVPLGFGWYGVKSARSKMPGLLDQMRTELHI